VTKIGRRLALAFLGTTLALAAFAAGLQFVGFRVPTTHPLTGRKIAGIATNAAWMDRAEREREEEPDRALGLIGIRNGMVVADVGAGTGYMTLRLARLVGPSGRVYATDIQPSMLAIIDEKAGAAHLSNITVVQSSDTDPKLPADGIDLELLVDVYHEFARPQPMLRGLRRALRLNGRLVVVEYRGEDPTIPIAPTHRMSVADAKTEIEPEGFTFDQLIQGLPRQHISPPDCLQPAHNLENPLSMDPHRSSSGPTRQGPHASRCF
jgi:SAM-dependent methyltransferase